MLKDTEQYKRRQEEVEEKKDKIRKAPISNIIGGVIGFMVIMTLLMLLINLFNS